MLGVLVAAAAGAHPQFEAASIKPSKSTDRRRLNDSKPELFRVYNATARWLIQQAYGIKAFQIQGGPPWAGSDLFDIVAKPQALVNSEQLKTLLQSLLAERFQLEVRHETREAPVYALLVGKNGAKSKVAAVTEGPVRVVIRRGLLDAPAMDMAGLAGMLSEFTGVKVLDQTGLTGRYAVRLQWIPDENQVAMFQSMGVPEGYGAPAPDPMGATLFAALQEQLGLRLESQKGPVDMLVIEHIERPSAN
jgi:uncharacterized protein (TIGR03435 family)